MLEAVFVPLQRREHRQQCDERPHRSHGFDIRLNSQGEEAVEGARCIGGADDRRRVDEDAEIDESERRERLHHPAQAPRASTRRGRGQPSAGCQSPATDHDPLMHCSCLSSAQLFSSGGARAALALVRRNRRAARVRGKRGAPSRIGRRRGCGAGRQLFREDAACPPSIPRATIQVASNRLAPRRDARLKLAAPMRMFAFAPRF